jgi:hypothetical protein
MTAINEPDSTRQYYLRSTSATSTTSTPQAAVSPEMKDTSTAVDQAASTPLLTVAVPSTTSATPPPQPFMPYQLPECYNPQTQSAFNLMLHTITSKNLQVLDSTGKECDVSELAKLVSETATFRAGGPLSKEEIDTAKHIMTQAKTLTRKEAVERYCHRKLESENATGAL